MGVRNKAILSMTLLILILCGFFLFIIQRQGQQNLDQLIESKTTAASQVAESVLSQISQQYQLRIKSFINDKASQSRAHMLKAFADQDREALFKLSEPFLDILKKENPYFTSLGWILPDNQTFLKVHRPNAKTENISEIRLDVSAVNRERVQHSGFTLGRDTPQFRLVQPVFYQGEYIGAVQMGIDSRFITEILRQKLHLSSSLLIPANKYESRGGKRAGDLANETYIFHTSDRDLFDRLINKVDWESLRQKVMLSGQSYALHKILSLNDFRGKRLGDLFVAIDITEMTKASQKVLISALFLSLLMLLLIAVIFNYGFGLLVSRIVSLNESLEKSNLELEDRVEERTRELIEETEERKNAEEKLHRAEKMEAIGLMASGVAHDLNNILSGVISYPELLLMRLPEDSKLRQPITSIKESGLRAAAVVEDLLTVARDAATVRTLVDMNTLILEYIQSSETETLLGSNSKVVIETSLGTDLPQVYCSPSHVNKCLMNLVVNASEAFSAAGKIIISSSMVALPGSSHHEISLPAGDYVVVAVEDNGPGIFEEDLTHVFEPFYTKKKMGRSGTGIGLAVVWNCMEDHGGLVSVQSDKQRGTIFTLLFPVGDEKTESPAGGSDGEVIAFKGRGETILVVDDEVHLRDIAVQILEGSGYRAEAVSSGEDAIAYVKKHPVDLLLLDMMMEPGLDGCETFAEIVKNYPEQKAVIVSGYAGSEQVEKTLASGATSFLKKPYTVEQLEAAVGIALQGEGGE